MRLGRGFVASWFVLGIADARSKQGQGLGVGELTRRADIVQDRMRPDLCIDRFHKGSHLDDVCGSDSLGMATSVDDDGGHQLATRQAN